MIYQKEKAVLIRVSLFNLELADPFIPVPYIPTSKCKNIYNATFDNGRILSAEVIGEITLTDIDYQIIKKQYKFDMQIHAMASARYGKLPQPLRDCVAEYFQNKTSFKDKDSDTEHTEDFYTLLYNKMKALLNAQYGMMAQNPVKSNIQYDPEKCKSKSKDNLYIEDDSKSEEDLLEDYNSRAFLAYQWGVWVTARAREHLQKGIDLCGINFVYCDTDSCKYLGNDVDWNILNKEYIKLGEKYKTYGVDTKGIKHYLGVFDQEKHIKRFKTLGAKNYAYVDDDGKLHITIAGVNKKIGAIELKRAARKHDVTIGPPVDPLFMMDEGFKFIYAGGIEARYSDYPDITRWITEDGVPLRITRNVSLVENTKTLCAGKSFQAYKELLVVSRRMLIDL